MIDPRLAVISIEEKTFADKFSAGLVPPTWNDSPTEPDREPFAGIPAVNDEIDRQQPAPVDSNKPLKPGH